MKRFSIIHNSSNFLINNISDADTTKNNNFSIAYQFHLSVEPNHFTNKLSTSTPIEEILKASSTPKNLKKTSRQGKKMKKIEKANSKKEKENVKV
jgi:hypothetical protein